MSTVSFDNIFFPFITKTSILPPKSSSLGHLSNYYRFKINPNLIIKVYFSVFDSFGAIILSILTKIANSLILLLFFMIIYFLYMNYLTKLNIYMTLATYVCIKRFSIEIYIF